MPCRAPPVADWGSSHRRVGLTGPSNVVNCFHTGHICPYGCACTSTGDMPECSGSGDGQKHEVTMSTERQLGEVRFLTVAEVATIMRVSKMTVYRMVHAGELPAIRVGRSFRVPEDEVHTYLRSSFVDTA